MAVVLFYEKPGCPDYVRHKAALARAGHDVVCLDVRVQTWTPDSLLPFLAGRPVAQWFNRAAPRVRSGAVIPERMDAAEALAALCVDPLMIRLPLMESGGRRMAGFDETEVAAWLGLAPDGSARRC